MNYEQKVDIYGPKHIFAGIDHRPKCHYGRRCLYRMRYGDINGRTRIIYKARGVHGFLNGDYVRGVDRLGCPCYENIANRNVIFNHFGLWGGGESDNGKCSGLLFRVTTFLEPTGCDISQALPQICDPATVLSNFVISASLDVRGESVFIDENKIATFQSSGANSFISLQNNNGATDGTSLGYFESGVDKYFYIDTPEGGFGDLVVRENGLVGINTTNPLFLLHVNGTAGKPGGGLWTNSSSDRRLKRRIRSYDHGLQKILQIRPVWYQYIDRFDLPVNQDFVGIIAQEIQDIAPYMVGVTKYQNEEGENEEYLNFNGNALTFMLINAVQEQEKTIIEQKEIVEKQQIQISQLLNEMVKIQKLLGPQIVKK